MPRKPDDRVDQARSMYLQGMKLVEIASQLSLPEGTVRRWKCTYKWDDLESERSLKNNERSDKKKKKYGRGKNPNSHHNATGPPGNKNAEKHGFFSKWLPEETIAIIGEMPNDPLELIWDNIQLQFAAIIRAQKLMHVRDHDDKTVEKIEHKDGDNVFGERWEVQQAWDKQANFMAAQSRAMKTLESMIKQYDEMLHKNWEMASDEQKARLELLQAQKRKLEEEDKSESDEVKEKMDAISGIAMQMIAPEEDEYE